jgi:uncharacterized protein (UPF0332 family)
LTDDPVGQLIQYRLDQANETLREGEVLKREGLWHGVTNRAYYAMFYAALALVVLKNETISKHSGVIAFFDREFVRTGIIPKEYSRMFHLAFERRQINDYGEFSLVDEGEAQSALEEAVAFVTRVEQIIQALSGET